MFHCLVPVYNMSVERGSLIIVDKLEFVIDNNYF